MNLTPVDLQQSFKALADPTRRGILMHLSRRDMTIAEVTTYFDMTRAAVKKHLNILERGNLIRVEVNGRERINKIEMEGLRTINNWLSYFDQYWDNKIESLRDAIENDSENSNQKER